MPAHDSNILLELFTIFLWAKIFAEIFEYFSIPAVLGEILAGAVLGPHAVNLIQPSDFTVLIAEIGAVFLLLSVGLETHPQDLIRVGRQSLGVALGGVLLPFMAGFGYMMWQQGSPHEATFVAAAMVATSVGITARVLRDMGALAQSAARIILGAAVFDDILGMLILAVVAGLAGGAVHWLELGVLAVEAAAFAVFMIFVAPRLIRKVRPQIESFSIPNAPLFLTLALGLGLSAAAENIGLAAIIGAFFAGLAFADYGTTWNLHPRIQGISEFLSPFFFFTIGAQLDVTLFSSGTLVKTAVVVSLLAIASKLVGCGLPVLREGWRTALQVGVGMVPRGEVGLIVAALGLRLKLISEASYAVVIFMTMVTTIIAPPVLRHLFKSQGQPVSSVAGALHVNKAILRQGLDILIGLLFCGSLALLMAILFRESHSKALVPVGFLVVVTFAARLWGRAAGVLGTLAAALVFALSLFTPLGSWAVSDYPARSNLGWMMLGGLSLSYFIGRRPRSGAAQ